MAIRQKKFGIETVAQKNMKLVINHVHANNFKLEQIGDKEGITAIENLPPFATKQVVKEAIRQLVAAEYTGYTVEWLVSYQEAAIQLKNIFRRLNIKIDVIFFQK